MVTTNTSRTGGQPIPPVRQSVSSAVPPGAQPGMTPTPGVSNLQSPPPAPEDAWRPAPAEPTGTVLDELMDLMDPMMWQLFLAIITYAQMIDDMSRGEARLSKEYQGAVLAPFLGFGPAHVWKAMRPDLQHTLLRNLVRWMKDPKWQAESTLTWRVMDLITPGLCLQTKGEQAFHQSLIVLERIKPEFA